MKSWDQQLDLFENREPQFGKTVEERVVNNKIHVSRSTFKGRLDARFHRWFRLTPSFGPELVHHVLAELGATNSSVVLDPFAGAGTTLIECKLNNLECYGFEINPFLHFVGKTSLHWIDDTGMLRQRLTRIGDAFARRQTELRAVPLEECGLPIPPIHNVYRWWRPDVLKDLLILRNVIDAQAKDEQNVRDFFRLAIAGVLVPDLTNVTLGRLQLHFIDRSTDRLDVWRTFYEHACRMIDDLEAARHLPKTRVQEIYLEDATQVSAEKHKWRADIVITSPPYPNRYSYVWNTRPHLYFFGFFTGRREAADLDKRTIGGTWGTATSVLAKGIIEPAFPVVEKVVVPVAADIRKLDNLMANYLMKYFNLLAQQIVAMDPLLKRDAQVAYVVGNSRLKGVYVETDVLLAKIFEGLGLHYTVSGIERFRRRHSGKDLFESIVYARKH